MQSSHSHSPTDFAFELPSSDGKNYNFTPNSFTSASYSGYSTGGSSFSSTSGSLGGTSFSSTDNLPAISRDFSRPNVPSARRPQTAAGALQSRFGEMIKDASPQQPSLFSNPFDVADQKPAQATHVDPRFAAPSNRRASESIAMPPPSWPMDQSQSNEISAMQLYQQRNVSVARPQTSDGLPSFGGQSNLPSARAMMGSIDGFTPLSTSLQSPAQIRPGYQNATQHRNSYSSKGDGELTFVPLGGPTPRKRPRRRYDEIERLYLCGWNGCEKSYGTLNHLNAHVAMQKHGEKRLPQEFREMRKAWRKKKREQNAAANAEAWNRSSLSGSSDYERRESNLSMVSSADGRYAGTSYSYDSRPNTASSVASSDGRPYSSYSQPGSAFSQASNNAAFGAYSMAQPGMISFQQQLQQHQQQQQQQQQHQHQHHPSQAQSSQQPSQADIARRGSAPQHISMPTQPMGFRPADDGVTPTPQNPFPNMQGMGMMHGTAMAMNGAGGRPMSGPVTGGQQHQQQQQSFPFQALTQPMPMMEPQYGQFAFR